MKRTPGLLLLAVVVAATVSPASIFFLGGGPTINFTDAKDAAAKADWSEPKKLSITAAGLGWDGDAASSWDGWIQTKPVALGTSWRPATGVHVRLEISPTPKPFKNASGQTSTHSAGNVFVRYSPDCKHWSTWQVVPQDTKATGVRAFAGELLVSMRQREPYDELLSEYAKLDVPWASDEEAAVIWMLQRKPDLFERCLPFIGYVELLFEGPFGGGERITNLTANFTYGIGGLHAGPKDPKVQEKHQGPWRFKAE